jgi:hypothetical protein
MGASRDHVATFGAHGSPHDGNTLITAASIAMTNIDRTLSTPQKDRFTPN